jgi:hypothetical protein
MRFVTNRRCPERIANMIIRYHDSLESDHLKRQFNYFMLYVKGTGDRWTWKKWNTAKIQFENLNNL